MNKAIDLTGKLPAGTYVVTRVEWIDNLMGSPYIGAVGLRKVNDEES